MKPREKYVTQVGWYSIAANAVLFVLKYWAGIVSGSIALIADAWDTLTDCISSFIVVVGGKVAGKPADKEHPFGHGRAEHIAAIVIGVLLSILAFNFIVGAYEKFVSREGGQFGVIAIAVTIASVVVKELLALYGFWVAKRTGSSVLKANSWNFQADALASVFILAGILLGRYYWWMDSVLGLILAFMIARASYEILSKEIKALLGEEVDPEVVTAITSEVTDLMQMNVHIHHFHLHKYGSHQELSCHIKLPATMSLDEAHGICTRIEDLIKERFEMNATIHPEPLEK
ncbi:MAG: cation diffusion facilitator family transporter [Prolixibacteraceae bacterium]